MTVTPFDKALLKCPTAVQVEVVKNLYMLVLLNEEVSGLDIDTGYC